MADVQDNTKYQEEILKSYMDQLDDFENRDRRQNIRIRGLPETYTSNLVTIQSLFHQILGETVLEAMEVHPMHIRIRTDREM